MFESQTPMANSQAQCDVCQCCVDVRWYPFFAGVVVHERHERLSYPEHGRRRVLKYSDLVEGRATLCGRCIWKWRVRRLLRAAAMWCSGALLVTPIVSMILLRERLLGWPDTLYVWSGCFSVVFAMLGALLMLQGVLRLVTAWDEPARLAIQLHRDQFTAEGYTGFLTPQEHRQLQWVVTDDLADQG